jgi:hypothetical protein
MQPHASGQEIMLLLGGGQVKVRRKVGVSYNVSSPDKATSKLITVTTTDEIVKLISVDLSGVDPKSRLTCHL